MIYFTADEVFAPAWLSSAAIRIEVDVSHALAEASKVCVRVNRIHEVGVAWVQSHLLG